MSLKLSQTALEKEIRLLAGAGVSGRKSDFRCWIEMEVRKRTREIPEFSDEELDDVIQSMKQNNLLENNPENSEELRIPETSELAKRAAISDSFEILGEIQYSPMHYVKSRIEYFLKKHSVAEDTIIDISIGAVEAMENAVKYGDGGAVKISVNLDRKRNFTLEMTNAIGVVDLAGDIKRGKFSVNTTLMRGMMVMQKLFDSVDLDILEDSNTARLLAKKNVG